MTIVDVVNDELAFGVAKIKLLAECIVHVHVRGCLHPRHVQLITIPRERNIVLPDVSPY